MDTRRLSIDEYWLKILEHVAARSTCARRAVGAILTTEKGQILSTGYNGTVAGAKHCTEHPCIGAQDMKGDTRFCFAVHAEQNVILQCQRLDLAHTLYVSCTPCFTCAKMIANTPVKRIVALETYKGDDLGLSFLQDEVGAGRWEVLVRDQFGLKNIDH